MRKSACGDCRSSTMVDAAITDAVIGSKRDGARPVSAQRQLLSEPTPVPTSAIEGLRNRSDLESLYLDVHEVSHRTLAAGNVRSPKIVLTEYKVPADCTYADGAMPASLARTRRRTSIPIAGKALPEQPQRRVPRAVLPLEQPTPVGPRAQQDPGRLPEGACEVRHCGVDCDH
jgi:hypothetical protein